MKTILTSLLLLIMPSATLSAGQAAPKAAVANPSPNPFLLAPESFRKLPSAQKALDRTNVDQKLLSAAIFHATNAQRARHKLPPFVHAESLRRAAQGHSQAMATNGFFSHKNPNDRARRTMQQRLALEGVTEGWRSENIAKTPVQGLTCLAAAEVIVTQWMNSRPHRAAILDRNLRYLGCGAHADPKSPHFYILATQNFATAVPEAAAP